MFEKDKYFNRHGYIGPPSLSREKIEELRLIESPKLLTNRLVEEVKNNYPDADLIHQNGWSNEELIRLVSKYGFKFVTSDMHDILGSFSFVPNIVGAKSISTVFLFEPV